ncbi:NADH-quinone oxidoreductase subunit N [Methanosalsum natronophilum]|uniref:NADH-quinone oxidoreductase subunit N n=1 Tax=Methanosalsum natronophilum TaxID=768733 RepID=UPI00216970D5|nr:NADH-quinone oxidoreductase subunit N [Methanosalsum natronophilum]MCS3923192.1 NADH-quinone oxidoreductase subunit N [Methanosalsum natronophilum]
MEDILLLAPEIILAVTALVVLVAGLYLKTEHKVALGFISVAGIIMAIALTMSIMLAKTSASMFYDTMVIDPLSQVFKLVFLSVALLVSIASVKYVSEDRNTEEFFALLLLAIIGMMVVSSSNDLITLFLGFELAGLATYALVGFEKKNIKVLEASMKYFIIGAVSSAFLLFGMSYVYGMTGTTNIPGIAANAHLLVDNPIGIVAIVMLIAGFGYKMSLVPFHMWAPDTYQGAPSVISALLAGASKKMGFIAAFKVIIVALIALNAEWQTIFAVLAVITMTLGNVVALSQDSVKRMLAYSSVAQAGYISMAFVVLTPTALAGGILYILSHAFMKAGAFIAVAIVGFMILVGNKDARDTDHIDNFRGLSKRMPITAFALMVFLLALAGIPATAGFVSKFVLFSSTIEAGLVWLAVIAILNSAISLFYYARVIKYMYFMPTEGGRITEPAPYAIAMILALVAVLVIGIWPEPFIYWASEAANVLLI